MLGRHVFDRLAPFADHQLAPAERTHVEAHLQRCERCRHALAEIRRGIAFASELEPLPMPDDVAARIRRTIVDPAVPPRHSRRAAPLYWRIAALILLAVAGVGLYWQLNRPWAVLHAASAVANSFEAEGRTLHDQLRNGEVALAFAASDDDALWQWLAAQGAPVTGLRPNRSSVDRQRCVPLGATVRTIAGVRTSVIAYRIDGRPVTLMLARQRDVPDAPSPGWWSKRITHRRDSSGVNTLTWTVGGGTYVLVSEVGQYGQQACFICHTDERFQRPIRELHLR